MENQPGISQEFAGMRKGDYEILALLGTGGMGQVFKVRNIFSDRIEAMKVLLPNLADQKNLADRFVREIRVLAGLHHPNIAELRTALTINNELVMIMEYVEGTTLAARIQQGAIPYGQALGYIEQALSALGYAHKQHIIHRDIKPSNMMLTPEGVVKLMDFGIAQRGDQGELTKTNTTVGSFAYMSPEQIKGEPVDARSDLYSVGVSLYEMVTGQRPFPADTAFSAMQAHLQTAPRPPIELRPDLPLPLSQLILMAVAKDPAARFQSADAFAAALKTVAPKVAGTVAAIPVPASVATPTGVRAATVAASAAAAAPAPAAMPAAQAAVAKHSSHRGLYIALGAAIVLVVLAAAAIVPRHAKTAALKKQSTSSPALTAPSAPSVAPAAASDATPPTPSPTSPASEAPRANSPAVANSQETQATPDANAVSAPTAPAPSPRQPRSAAKAPQTAAPSAAPVQDTSATVSTLAATAAPTEDEMQALDTENDQLSGRATSVSASLDNLQKQQAAQGLGLRGDIVASQQRMQTYMNKAQTALQAKDAAGAKKYLDLANTEVEKLEKFLGR